MRSGHFVLGFGIAVFAGVVPAAAADGTGTAAVELPRKLVVESDPLLIDRIYHSMEGPYQHRPIDGTDIDWMTGYHAEVLDPEGKAMGDEFFCHSHLRMGDGTRLFVTATGAAEVEFPRGFAMPVRQIMSGLDPRQRQLILLGMVLNNHDPDMHQTARIRWTIDYLKDEDLPSGVQPKKLYKFLLPMTVEDIEGLPAEASPMAEDTTTHCALVDGMTAHWIVPPGPQRTRKRYSGFVPVDGTIHYMIVHLHNHARYLRLSDVTTGKTMWQTDVEYEPERVQIAKIPVYSSEEGMPIYADHEYEIEAFYDNTSDAPVDAMATLNLYYHPRGNIDITYSGR